VISRASTFLTGTHAVATNTAHSRSTCQLWLVLQQNKCACTVADTLGTWSACAECSCAPGPQTPVPGARRRVIAGARYDGQRLLWFDEAPRVLQFNKYVLSGYRAGERCVSRQALQLTGRHS